MEAKKKHNYFRKRNNVTKCCLENFWVYQAQSKNILSNMIFLHAYGESKISPDGVTVCTSKISSCFSHWVVELITAGEGVLICNNHREKLHAGDICLLKPSIHHKEIQAAENSKMQKRVLMINRSSIISILCGSIIDDWGAVVHPRNGEKIKEILDKIRALCIDGDYNQSQELSVLTYQIILEIIGQCRYRPRKSILPELLYSIIADPAQDYSRENMADFLGVNVRTLTELFKKAVGMSPTAFVIDCRMKRAVELIESDSSPIYIIAELCGYKNSAFFSREFKKHFGKTPLDYAKGLKSHCLK